jgi:hypothetical protein
MAHPKGGRARALTANSIEPRRAALSEETAGLMTDLLRLAAPPPPSGQAAVAPRGAEERLRWDARGVSSTCSCAGAGSQSAGALALRSRTTRSFAAGTGDVCRTTNGTAARVGVQCADRTLPAVRAPPAPGGSTGGSMSAPLTICSRTGRSKRSTAKAIPRCGRVGTRGVNVNSKTLWRSSCAISFEDAARGSSHSA